MAKATAARAHQREPPDQRVHTRSRARLEDTTAAGRTARSRSRTPQPRPLGFFGVTRRNARYRPERRGALSRNQQGSQEGGAWRHAPYTERRERARIAPQLERASPCGARGVRETEGRRDDATGD